MEKNKTFISVYRETTQVAPNPNWGTAQEFISIPHNVDEIRVTGSGSNIFEVATGNRAPFIFLITSTNLIANVHDYVLAFTANEPGSNIVSGPKSFRASNPAVNSTYTIQITDFEKNLVGNLLFGDWFICLEFVEYEKK